MNTTIAKLQFTEEGTSIIFFPKEGKSGDDIGKEHFDGCCDYESTRDLCIVRTASLQEMGFSLSF